MKKRKILISAYSCEPGFSSEREIGWKWSNLLSVQNEVYVLTRLSNKKIIDEHIEESGEGANLNFVYYDLPHWARKWKKGEKGLYVYYALWQFGALLAARKLNKNIKFDITHYITFGSMLLPHFMFLMPTKFVLGPVGGGENTPLRFIGGFSLKGRLVEIIRQAIQLSQKINPFFLFQCMKADKLFVRTKESLAMVPSVFHHKTELMLETGVPEELLTYESKIARETDGIRIITIGRFIPSKINILTLKVILEFKAKYGKPFKFYIVGDGAERKKLEAFCAEHGLEEEVVFTGWVSRSEVFEQLSQSDIYFSTTFKEGGTWAFFEAVAMGLPVACLKISGPDMIVADGCGVKIKPVNPKQVINELSDGLYQLATDDGYRDLLANKARENLLERMTWEKMVSRVESAYDEVLCAGEQN